MWDEPRKGTEAYAVKQEAEKRKKQAEDKGLPQLFSNVYHDNLTNYPFWISNDKNKRYVYPGIASSKEVKKTKIDGNNGIEFIIDNKNYLVTEKDDHYYMSGDKYVDLFLYINGEKVFAIRESVVSDEWITYYSPTNVNAYVNEDWVNDFKAIQVYRKRLEEEDKIRYSEDPEKIEKLKNDFGITDMTLKENSGLVPKISQNQKNNNSIWILIIVIIIALYIFG